MKRFFALLLSVLMLSGVLAGCKKENESVDTQGSQNVTTEDTADIVSEYPVHPEWEKSDFHFLTDSGYNADRHFIEKEYNGDPIVEQSVLRTMYVEENYNINMVLHEDSQLVNLVRNDLASGSASYDMIFPHPTAGITTLMIEGCLANILDYSSVLSLDREWYNKSQIENYTINNKLYLVASDYTILGQGFTGIVYNKEIFNSNRFDMNIYELVDNGEWTYDKMLTLLKPFDSVGEDTENKTYGLALHEGYLYTWSFAFGETILVRNSDGEYEIGFNNTRLTGIAEKIYDLCWSNNAVIRGTATNATFPDSVMFETFKNGKSLMITFDIGGLYNLLRNLEFNIGILPTPKWDTNQEDYRVMCASGFLAIPSGAKDGEKSAVILEILSRISYRDMLPAYFENILLGRLSHSADDYRMLELMHSKKYYDLGVTLDEDSVVRYILSNVVVTAQSKNIPGYIRQKQNSFDKLVDLANSLS